MKWSPTPQTRATVVEIVGHLNPFPAWVDELANNGRSNSPDTTTPLPD